MSNDPSKRAPHPYTEFRPLPAYPNLEFERKAAKKLLASLRRGDADAIGRARAQKASGAAPAGAHQFKLADAQFIVAREYGFMSWPKLVHYYEAISRQEWTRHKYGYPMDFHEKFVEGLLREHKQRRKLVGRMFATLIPRFYGKSVQEVFDSEVTRDDAMLVEARRAGAPSWEALKQMPRGPRDDFAERSSPFRRASQAVRDSNLPALKEVVEQHPEALEMSPTDFRRTNHLMLFALMADIRKPTRESRAIIDYLASRGISETATRNEQLIFQMHGHATAEGIEELLRQGADPNWIAPNGYSVLEHALVRYVNGDAVDVIARRVTPRKGFWISAGLGDVKSVARYFDKQGKLRPSARNNRPDFTALGTGATPALPDADDTEIIWEAFHVAALNGRYEVLQYLLDRGFPINYIEWGQPILYFATAKPDPTLVQFLLERGADPDLKGYRPESSPREQSLEFFLMDPSEQRRRVFQLFGGRDPDAVLREYRERPAPEPVMSEALSYFISLAREEAVRLGQQHVEPHNIFVAFFRGKRPIGLSQFTFSGMNADCLHEAIASRLVDPDPHVASQQIAFGDEAEAVLEHAFDLARQGKETHVHGGHLLRALLGDSSGFAAKLVGKCGGSVSRIMEELARH